MALDVVLTNGLTQGGLHQRDRTLPALAHLGHTRQGGAEEVEVLLDECGAEVRGRAAQGVPEQPRLPGRSVEGGEQLIDASKERWLTHDDSLEHVAWRLRCLEVGGEVEVRENSRPLVQGGEVVGAVRFAVGHRVPVVRRNGGFQCQYALRVSGTVGNTGESEHPLHVLNQGHQERCVLGVAVVRLVGHAQSALTNVGQVARGVALVSIDEVIEKAAVAARTQGAENLGEVSRRGHGLGQYEIVGNGADAQLFDARFVHEGGVKVTDLLGGGANGGRLGSKVFNNGLNLRLGVLAQLVEGTKTATVAWDLNIVEPRAVRELEQIVLWSHRGLHGCRVQTAGAVRVVVSHKA